MFTEENIEIDSVQQEEVLTGQVMNEGSTVAEIVGKAVNQPTAEEQQQELLRQMLRDTRIRTDTAVPEMEYALEVDDVGFFALRDIHAIKAKAKAGKTTTLKVIMAALLKGRMFRLKSKLTNPRIVYFDTEQNRKDSKRILEDVAQMTGIASDVIDRQVALHSLRRVERENLLPLLKLSLEEEKPNVVIIDGIVEFIASFNDEIESKQIIKELLMLCDEYNCAIICVLHTNKGVEDHSMRGHTGSMLAQKAATVLECIKERGSNVIIVSCSESRHEEPTTWSIMFDQNGCIVDADEQRRLLMEQHKAEQLRRHQEASENEKRMRLEHCLRIIREKSGFISRKQLTEILVKELERNRSTVSSYISVWLKEKVLVDVDGMIQDSNNMLLNLSPR